ncbi:MAG: diacylglycerol kinase family protein, partial [Spirochaetota bacterium]
MLHLLSALEYQIEHILRRTALFAGRHLSVDMIINPEAGTLSSEKRAVATVEHLNRLARGIVAPLRGDDEFSIRFHLTHYVGHAREIARAMCARSVPDVHLIVSAGGDGTHGEVLSSCDGMLPSGAGDKELFFVRLPFGTGNDGADAPDLPTAVRLLLGCAEQRRTGQVVVTPHGMPA